MDTLLPLVLSLTQVVAYPQGGSYRYAGMLSAKKGLNTFIWEGLPPQTDPRSVRVTIPGSSRGYIVQTSVEPLATLTTSLPLDVQALRQRIDSLEGLLSRVRQRLAVLALQERALTENIRLGGEEGTTSSAEIERYLFLIERRLTALLEEKAPLEKRQAALNDTLTRWRQVYENRLAGLRAQRAVLYVTYWAPQPEVVPVRVELSGPPAGWSLSYRIRALPGEGKVVFQRWAAVRNLSGEDWRDVQLILSTGTPEASGAMPPFQSWYVDIFTPPAPGGRYGAQRLAMEYKAQAEASSEDGDTGEQTETLSPPMPVQMEQTLSRSYDLGQQRLPAGTRQAQFFLQADTITAAFRFFINAAAEEAAYLRAGLPAAALMLWEAAPAVIEVDGQEVARLTWQPIPAEDTVWLDLGRSPRLLVKRIQIDNRRETRLSGGTIHHHFAYRLQVSHTYTAPIQLVVWERIPISRHSDIKVDLTDAGGGIYDSERGQLRWQLTLTPGETWEKVFRFTVKYPRQRQIIGL